MVGLDRVLWSPKPVVAATGKVGEVKKENRGLSTRIRRVELSCRKPSRLGQSCKSRKHS
jgi:hypothetical protein